MNPSNQRSRRTGRFVLIWVLALFTGAATSAWSRDSVVVFNEVHYHPPSGDTLEWIELHNQNSVDVEMSAWRLDGGIQFNFELGTVIPGGGYLVVASDPSVFKEKTGIDALGPFMGQLANGGEEIVLYKHNRLQVNDDLSGRRVMDRLIYGDNDPWPVAPDGSGVTLAKVNPDSGTAQAENWTASAQLGGTPGAVNFPSADDVQLEVVTAIERNAVWRFNESGDDLGSNWAESNHPVGGNWKEGAGALGFEAKIDEFIGTPLIKPSQTRVVTHYFERELVLAQGILDRIVRIDLEHLIDDGAIFYINGEEILRYNMPDGQVGFETLADSGKEAEWISLEGVNGANLAEGANRISVEVHQSTTGSSDVAFGLGLRFALSPQESARGGEFQDLVINEISSPNAESGVQVELRNLGTSPISIAGAVLSVSGDPARQNVVADGVELGGGQRFVVDGTLAVSDRDRLFLYAPDRQSVIDARQISSSGRARVESGEFEGRWLRPDKSTIGEENSFSLSRDVVINEILYHGYPDRGSPPTAPEIGQAVIVPMEAEWRYFENVSGEGLSVGWAASEHLEWPSGPALLGREPTGLEEPIRTPLSHSRTQVTYYFEKEFEFEGDPESGLGLRHLVDDGAIFYLNGEEIGRFNMTDGLVLPATLASENVNNAESVEAHFPDARPVLGTNRFSVEVHQFNVGSSDIIFGTEILGSSVVNPGDPGRPYAESEEEWIELFNRGSQPVDLSHWTLSDAVRFEFPLGTTLASGEYLVVSNDPEILLQKHPGIQVFGPFSGRLSNRSERILLSDVSGNPADELVYADSGRWPSFADGGGASLELRDPFADNSIPEAWGIDNGSTHAEWHTVSYRGVAVNDRQGANTFHEFLLGMLDAGELLLDDVSVIEDPDGEAIEFIQNGDFEGDAVGGPADKWRTVGTHGSHGRTVVVADPDNPANKCLHVIATGPTEDKHNKIETTFAARERVSVGTEYQISFRAKWLAGSNQVNTRLYFNYLQRTHHLPVPDHWGTPGKNNSIKEGNIGPLFDDLSHEPAVPQSNQQVRVSVAAFDPDGIASVSLNYRLDGEEFTSLAMERKGDVFSAAVPGQGASDVVQFYVEAMDQKGAVSVFPPLGADSGAMFKVDDGRARLEEVHNVRIIMLDDDRRFLFRNTNRMSNDRLRATVIYDEKTVYHDVGVRLKGSAFGRYNSQHYGYNIEFDPSRKFRGVHRTVSIERSPPLKEIFAKHLLTQAGGPGFSFYDDVGRVIAPLSRESGVCLFSMARHTSEFFEGLDGEDSSGGTLFNHELLYNPNGASGGPEGLKINNPYNHNGGRYDFSGRGTDKEAYRWGFQIRSNRGRDDYSSIIGAGLAMSMSGDASLTAAEEFIDIDQWSRGLAAMSLIGNDDTYTRIWEHNLRYYARPSDGKLILMPWDLDRAFQLGTNSQPIGGNAVGRLFRRDVPEHLFFGHAQDMIETVFNSEYATRWADHYGSLTGTRYRGEASYVRNRANFIASRIPDETPFEITTEDGTVSVGSKATIRGRGWVNVASIRDQSGNLYDLRWLDAGEWEISVSLDSGLNVISLEAYDLKQRKVGSDKVEITNTSTTSAPSAQNLAVSEIHYHPAPPSETEIEAGLDDQDAFEFLEITNIGQSAVDLAGAKFVDGIDFEFPENAGALGIGERLLLVSNAQAFRVRYGDVLAVMIGGEYTGSLRNGGEKLRFEDSGGVVIAEVEFDDAHPWPESADGSGFSLVFVAPSRFPDANDPMQWRPSAEVGGNPGSSDEIPFDNQRDSPLSYALLTNGFEVVDERLALGYTTPIGADAVKLVPEISQSLQTWMALPDVSFLKRVNHGDGTMTLFFELSEIPSNVAFGRIRGNHTRE